MSKGYKRTNKCTAEEGVERPDLAGVTGGKDNWTMCGG